MKKETFWFAVLILIGALIRLFYLGIVPPGNDHSFVLRLPTAFASIVTLILFLLIVKKLTKNVWLTFYTTLALVLMPWHIEQSRIMSPSMMGLAVILLLLLVWVYISDIKIRLISLVVAAVSFYFVYPTMWLFHSPYIFPPIGTYVANMFKLISFEFLFFKNDAFWKGAIREYGVMLPTLVPLFIIGLLTLLAKFRSTYVPFILFFFIVLWVAAGNPYFPDEREYFLVTPYLAFILGMGAYKVHMHSKKIHLAFKIVLALYVVAILYEHLLFTHFYIKHYSLRIQNDVPKEQRDF